MAGLEFVDAPTERMPTSEPEIFLPETPTIDMVGRRVAPPASDAELPPEWLEQYTYVRDLPGSSQATLWLYETADGEQVVIRQSSAPPRAHRLGLHELGELRHPHIVRSVAAPVERNWQRLEVLEFCERGSLAAMQRAHSGAESVGRWLPLDLGWILRVVAGMADALHYLHGRWIHTDIKPDNILLRSDGTPVLADFGSAVNIADPPSPFESGRTPQYSPGDDEFSPAWDWAQLGLTVITLATGLRNPSRDWQSVRFDELDPRVSLLISGLLAERTVERWGYSEVTRWLAGEDVELYGPDIRESSRRGGAGFVVDFQGRLCNSPAELGEWMASQWPEAVRAIQSLAGSQSYLDSLADQLGAVGDGREAEVRQLATLQIGDPDEHVSNAQVRHPDLVLAELVTCLNPSGTPIYGGPGPAIHVTRLGLARLAQQVEEAIAEAGDSPSEAEQSAAVLQLRRLFQLRLMKSYARVSGSDWLAEVDQLWHDTIVEMRRVLSRASHGVNESRRVYQERLRAAGQREEHLFEFQRGQWEDFAEGVEDSYADLVRAHALRALVDEHHLERIRSEADAAVEEAGESQSWFAQLAGGSLPPRAAGLLDREWRPPGPSNAVPPPAPRRLTQRLVAGWQWVVDRVTRRTRRG